MVYGEIYEKVACAAGHYCPADSLHMIPCPRGTWRDAGAPANPNSVSDCTASAAGFYADREGMTKPQVDDNLCAVGHKCESGSRDKYSVPCPPGTYQNEEGKAVCIVCPAASYCLGATVDPIPCPAGYYCK